MKSILNFSSGKNTDKLLLNQQSFSGAYQLTSKSCLLMEKDNPPVHVSAVSTIGLNQVVEKNTITTRINITDFSSESDLEIINKALQEIQIYTKINPVTEYKRNDEGEIIDIANLSEMWKKWEIWKEEELPEIAPEEQKQKIIIKNYEDGLNLFEKNMDKNLQNLILCPECYKFTTDMDQEEFGSTKTHYSRFVDNLELLYCLEKKTFTDDETIVKLAVSAISNVEEAEIEELISAYYELHYPDYSYKDYLFDISVEYTFDKYTSAILNAKLSFIEQIHPDFTFTIEMELIKEES